jgi:hypothetical protein
VLWLFFCRRLFFAEDLHSHTASILQTIVHHRQIAEAEATTIGFSQLLL